jgi:DNA oxidative demethylase
MVKPIAIAPGVSLGREYFDRDAQTALRDAVYARLIDAPFYRPVMPKTGTPFSVEETNFGTRGWLADVTSYRYVDVHPVTGQSWPDIPPALLALWNDVADYPAAPETALVNLYRPGAKMGCIRTATSWRRMRRSSPSRSATMHCSASAARRARDRPGA